MLHPGQDFGPYRLTSRIAAGGMGQVWRAVKRGEAGWEKAVALKVILPQLDEERFAKLFMVEARIAASLDHANIVPVTGFDRATVGLTTMLYIEMELVQGQDLRRVLGRTPLPLPLTLFVVAELLKGLAYAHQRGVIHRDIKPHNTLVSYEGAIKIADFGIAKLQSETASGSSNVEVKGTVGYIAPEVLDGHACTARSDLFAIGLILWECLTGKKLFDGATDGERIKRTFDCQVPPMRSVIATVPLELEEFAIRLLAREPTARFYSAREALGVLLAVPGARAAGSEELKQFLAERFPAAASVEVISRPPKLLPAPQPTPPTVSVQAPPRLPSVIVDLPELLSDGVPQAVPVDETRVLSRPDARTPTAAGESSPSAATAQRRRLTLVASATVAAAAGVFLALTRPTPPPPVRPEPDMIRPEPSLAVDAAPPDAQVLPDASPPPDAAPAPTPRRHRSPPPVFVPQTLPDASVRDGDGVVLPPKPN